jgi:putative ABC transport system permease protein
MMDLTYISSYLDDFYEIPPELQFLDSVPISNQVVIRLKSGEDPLKIQEMINKEYPSVRVAFTKDYYEQRILFISSSQSMIIRIMVVLAFIIGIVSTFTTFLIAIIERERELALLRVFGYSKYKLFIQILFEAMVIGALALIPTFFMSRIIAVNIWMAIVNESLFEMTPNYDPQLFNLMIIFTLLALLMSVFPSFIAATKRKMVDIIHEE